MANVPWLNINPSLQLQARQAGTAAGQNRAQLAQQAAFESARMDAAANELNARLRADAARLAMETAARTQMANDEAQLARETLRQRSAESALDRALRGREIGIRETQARNEALPIDLRELRDPGTGNLVGRAFGRSVQWTPEEVPTTGTPMVDAQGNVVANRFGNRVINIPRDRPKSQAEIDLEIMRMGGGSATNAMAAPAPMVESEKVTVVSPQGRIGTIPRSNLQRALQNGYRLQQ